MRAGHGKELALAVLETRRATLDLCAGLSPEDMVVQSMPDTSPTKWHLAHTTWFFERFVLSPLGSSPVRSDADWLFNSYYEAVGARHPRPKRGLLTRPSFEEIVDYRRTVDTRIGDLVGHPRLDDALDALRLGKNHEEQHQELIVTDALHLFSENALFPALRSGAPERYTLRPSRWCSGGGGVFEIGARGTTFAFDNEGPRHKVYLEPFSIASRLVTCGEYEAFIADGGYDRPELWMSEGWAWAKANARHAPLYWQPERMVFGVHGLAPMDELAPVRHVTWFEADAYARWAGARLPTEAEREVADAELSDVGEAWEWTASAYSAYPGFQPLEGAFGEYNGKFMVGQMVLRGGSPATPRGHARPTYRNFFPPHTAWQFTGIRLARSS